MLCLSFLVSAACAVYTIKSTPGSASALCLMSGFGGQAQRGVGVGPSLAQVFIGANVGGSLGLILAFAWKWLEGPL